MGNGNVTTDHVNKVMNEAVAEKKEIVNQVEIKKQFESKESLRFIKNDTYIADPKLLLGQIFYQKKDSQDLVPFIIAVDGAVDEGSILKSPQVRVEMLLDSKIGASIGIMSYLSLAVSDNEVFEFRVVDNMAARIIKKGDPWIESITKWIKNPICGELIANSDVLNIGVVTGVVQKYISTKKYRKFEAGVKGGAFGVNVGGELFTSTSEYALDIVYGLDLEFLPHTSDTLRFIKSATASSFITSAKEIENLNMAFYNMTKNTKDILKK